MKISRYSFIINRACLGLYFVTPVLHPLGMHSQNLYSPGLHFQENTYLLRNIKADIKSSCMCNPPGMEFKKKPPSLPVSKVNDCSAEGEQGDFIFSLHSWGCRASIPLSAERIANVSSLLSSFLPWSMKLLKEKAAMHSKKKKYKTSPTDGNGQWQVIPICSLGCRHVLARLYQNKGGSTTTPNLSPWHCIAAVHSTQRGTDGGAGAAFRNPAPLCFPFTLSSKPKCPGNACVFKVAKLLSLDCFPIICFTLNSPMGLIMGRDTVQYRRK